MNGFEIFNFTMFEQPKLLEEILNFSGKTKDDIDYYVFHQANKYIVETIKNAAKLDSDKVLNNTFEHFGNQVSASIAGTLCHNLAGTVKNKQVILQGFGIGLSWGALQLELNNTLIMEPKIYGPK